MAPSVDSGMSAFLEGPAITLKLDTRRRTSLPYCGAAMSAGSCTSGGGCTDMGILNRKSSFQQRYSRS